MTAALDCFVPEKLLPSQGLTTAPAYFPHFNVVDRPPQCVTRSLRSFRR